MLKRFTFSFTLFLLLSILQGYSQTIDITPAIVDTICPGDSVTLIAQVSGGGYGTNSYTFEVTPYHVEPFVNDTAVDPDFGANTDDAWAGPYPIGFEFCFLNQTYTQYWVGSNGWIGFTNPQGQNWTTYIPFTLPSTDSRVPKNAIFAPYQDWWPHHTEQNNVFRHIITDPPDNKLVVYWNSCPMYGCDGSPGPGGIKAPIGTFQIVLHEQNSIIENNITNKDSCSWQENASTQGVHNADGTLAYIAFKRNATSWTAYNESTRFVPSGISWFQDAYPGGTMVGQGDTIVLKPMITTTYFAVVNTCINGTATASKTVPVFPGNVPSIVGSTNVCMNNTEKYMTETGMTGYTWAVTNGTILSGGTAADDSVMVSWDQPTPPYTVSISYSDLNGCRPLTPTVINVTVNQFIIPVVTGVDSVCAGSQATFTTQAGNTNYLWTYPGATLISGGTTNDNMITLSWPAAGTKTISVNYTDPGGCTSNPPTTKSITVNPTPIPTFTGPAIVCPGTTHTYATDPGMTGYNWTISAGGTINSGQGSNSISVTWNVLGAQTLIVDYTDIKGCLTNNSPPYNVTVIPLPTPSFTSGENSVCLNISDKVYTTQAGKLNYIWNIPPQATVTAGGTVNDNSVTLTWNTVGTYSISVNYSEPTTGCTAASPTSFDVTVKSLPVPSFTTGENSVCLNIPGKVYTTEDGKSNYIWTIPPQATITSGGTGTDNSITLTWNTAGSYAISVNYTEPTTQCTAASPTPFSVTVKPLPVPIIAGPAIACVNTPGLQYYTEPGMSGYIWTVNGGTFTTGATPDTINVIWTSTGHKNLTVNYTAFNGCVAANPAVLYVDVSILPVPTITTGPDNICTDIQTSYTTQSGMSGYVWTVSPDGSVTGVNTDKIDVTWNTPGTKQVSVNYQMGPGCTGAAPATKSVMVNQITLPTITSLVNPICLNNGTSYTTQPGMSNYIWILSPGGNFTSPITGNVVNVTWNATGSQYVNVNFTNTYGCIAPVPFQYDVQVNPLPITTITAGTGPDCEMQQHVYQTPPDPACTFTWSANPGNVVLGQGTNLATINWLSPGPATVSVIGTYVSTTGCSSSSSFATTVYPSPVTSFTVCFDLVTTKNAKPFMLKGGIPLGGQYQGSPGITYDAVTGKYWFNPSSPLVSQGIHQITYFSQNSYGCSNTSSPVSINVLLSNVAFSCETDFIDPRDNQTYTTVKIGTQCWMAANLNYGTFIASTQMQRDNCIFEKYCFTDNLVNCTTYGGLYQWDELMQYDNVAAAQGFCPPGWHVPIENEWTTLFNFYISNGFAGASLKYSGYSGFNAFLSGTRFNNVNFYFSNFAVMFWSSTSHGPTKAWAHGMNFFNSSVSFYPSSRSNAFSVRCIKD